MQKVGIANHSFFPDESVLPYHPGDFPTKKSLPKPNSDGDPKRHMWAMRGVREMLAVAKFDHWIQRLVFLSIAEFCHGMAIGYDWLYPAIAEEDRKVEVLKEHNRK